MVSMRSGSDGPNPFDEDNARCALDRRREAVVQRADRIAQISRGDSLVRTNTDPQRTESCCATDWTLNQGGPCEILRNLALRWKVFFSFYLSANTIGLIRYPIFAGMRMAAKLA